MNDLTNIYVGENKEGLNPNLVFLVNEWPKWKILALQGSTRSGKTFSIVHFIISLIEEYRGLTISVTRATLPSLKTSILRDFKDEMSRLGLWSDGNFNKTELEYRHKGNLVEFFSVDDEQKVRGRKRQVLICNEANEIPQDRMMQLLLRTEGFVIIDYNPSMVDSYIYDLLERDDCAMLITTYKNNPFLSPAIVEEIERLKETDENLWKIYGCGIRGEDRAGTIYTRWVKSDIFPLDLPTWYGVDFGFSNDPTAIVRIAYDKKERIIYLKEVAYEKGLMNSDIARLIKQDIRHKKTQIYLDPDKESKDAVFIYTENDNIYVNNQVIPVSNYIDDHNLVLSLVPNSLRSHIEQELKRVVDYLFEVYCDSAEPKSIRELRLFNVSAYPAIKGGGSVASQIYFMYNFRVYYKGNNIDEERKKYKWKEKKGKDDYENVPIDAFNHILDAARYGVYTHLTRIGF